MTRPPVLPRFLMILAVGAASFLPSPGQEPAATSPKVGSDELIRTMREALGKGRPSIDLYRSHLSHTDENVRSTAVQLLCEEAGAAAIDDLVPLFEDPSENVVLTCTECLLRFDDPRTAAPVRAVLSGGSSGLRSQVISYVSDRRDARFVDDLGNLLSHKDLQIRRLAVEALRSIGSPGAFRYCMAATNDADGRLASYAVSCLEVLGRPEALPRLVILAESKEIQVRAAVSKAIPALGGTGAHLATLEKLLGDAAPVVRASVLTGLRLHPSDDALAILGKLAAGSDSRLRIQVAAALGANPAAGAEKLLVGMLDDGEETVRLAAVRAFGQREGAGVWKTIAEKATDPSPMVRLTVAVVLGELAVAESYPALERLAADKDETVRSAALVPAARLGGASSLGLLKKALKSEDKKTRFKAVQGLCEVDHPDSHALLRRIAGQGSVNERVLAMEALGRMGDSKAAPILQEARDHDDEKIRNAAREALRQLKAR